LSMVRGWLNFLLSPRVPLWRYCLTLYPISLFGSYGLFAAVFGLLRLAGIDPGQPPSPASTVGQVFLVVVFSPLVETLMLGAGVKLLSGVVKRPVWVAIISALLWGVLHGLFTPLWFFGTVWSFFLMSCAFMGWRKWSYRRAYMAAFVPHFLINLTVTLLLFRKP
jgi:hypothetical protein